MTRIENKVTKSEENYVEVKQIMGTCTPVSDNILSKSIP